MSVKSRTDKILNQLNINPTTGQDTIHVRTFAEITLLASSEATKHKKITVSKELEPFFR